MTSRDPLKMTHPLNRLALLIKKHICFSIQSICKKTKGDSLKVTDIFFTQPLKASSFLA